MQDEGEREGIDVLINEEQMQEEEEREGRDIQINKEIKNR